MVKTPWPRRQPLHDLPEAAQARQLTEQQGAQVPLTGPGPITRANTAIATVLVHKPGYNPTIKRFQKLTKNANLERRGRPQNLVWRLRFWAKNQAKSAVQQHSPKKYRTAVGEGRGRGATSALLYETGPRLGTGVTVEGVALSAMKT